MEKKTEVQKYEAPAPAPRSEVSTLPSETQVGRSFFDDMGFKEVVAISGKLKLTEEQKKILYEDFSDELVEIRADGIVYLPFIFYAQRLFKAFDVQWALVPLDKPMIKDDDVVCGYALVIRGIFMGSAYGSCRYHKTNVQMSYTDCVEGAKSECLRRLCKGMGIGLKLWEPEYIRQWTEKYTVKIYDHITKKTTVRRLQPGEEKTAKGWLKTKKDEKDISNLDEMPPLGEGKETAPPVSGGLSVNPPKPPGEPQPELKGNWFNDAVAAYIDTKEFKTWAVKHGLPNRNDVKDFLCVHFSREDVGTIQVAEVKEWQDYISNKDKPGFEEGLNIDTGQRQDQRRPGDPQVKHGKSTQAELLNNSD